MKKIILAVLILTINIAAQTGGKTGLSFLELGFGARNIALADLGVVVSKGASSQIYNPALLTQSAEPQVLFNHQTLFFDVSNQMIGANFRLADIPVAVAFQTTSISDIEVRLTPGEPISRFNAHYFMANISTAYEILNNLSAGVSVKYIYEDLFTDNSDGIGLDLGLFYKDLFDGLNLGASYRQIGSMSDLRNEATPLPENFRFGASYNFKFQPLYSDFQVSAGYLKYSASSDSHFQVAGEIIIKNSLALRLGYVTGFDSKDLTAGAGVNWGRFNFDYSFQPYKYDLGNSHIISISYDF